MSFDWNVANYFLLNEEVHERYVLPKRGRLIASEGRLPPSLMYPRSRGSHSAVSEAEEVTQSVMTGWGVGVIVLCGDVEGQILGVGKSPQPVIWQTGNLCKGVRCLTVYICYCKYIFCFSFFGSLWQSTVTYSDLNKCIHSKPFKNFFWLLCVCGCQRWHPMLM